VEFGRRRPGDQTVTRVASPGRIGGEYASDQWDRRTGTSLPRLRFRLIGYATIR
jgi:hypothetical protein